MTPRLRAIAIAVTLVCLALIALQVRRRQMRASYLVVWTSLCVVALPLIAIPGAVEQVSGWLGIYYPPATIFLVAIVILFLISVHFSRQLTQLEERTRVLAEELALRDVENPLGDSDEAVLADDVSPLAPAARGSESRASRSS